MTLPRLFHGLKVFARRRSQAFTLTELLVTIAIIAILASLTLAALNVASISAKRSSTESTIRKINEVLLGQYESYLSPRVESVLSEMVRTDPQPAANVVNKQKLIARRRLVALEMPERFTDIWCLMQANPSPTGAIQAAGKMISGQTVLMGRYQNIMSPYNVSDLILNDKNELAECLFLNVMASGYGDPDLVMHFRDGEMADTNGNGLREFVDAWGNPIQFLRWAPGFSSAFQPLPYSTRSTDPLDPLFLDKDLFDYVVNPTTGETKRCQLATRLVPLVVSGGPDLQLGIKTTDASNPANIDYSKKSFDPFYQGRKAKDAYLGIGPANAGNDTGDQTLSRFIGSPTTDASEMADNIHSHSMSR